MSTLNVCRSHVSRLVRSALCLFVTTFAVAAFAQTGRISGTVTSQSTGNALQGASVTATGGRTVLTDESGRFTLIDLPAGALKVTASYSGFKDQVVDVSVTPGGNQEISVVLASSDVVTLAPFTVETVKEGQALSVTQQRNAGNIKNVVALDEWGILPTQNVGELFTRMPGVGFTTDEDNLINNITVRGLVSSNGQSFTRLNIDGMSATGVGGNGRTATLHSFSAAMYEQLEVISGQTPDRRADALGGQINLKTRSPLAMKEKRRINYNFSGRYTPGTSNRAEALADHPFGYVASLGYSEVFDVFGGQRNFGLMVNAVRQLVVSQFDFDSRQYSNSLDPAAVFFRDYDKRSGTNHRFIDGYNIRADYRIADHTTVSATFIYNRGDEPFFHYTFVNPFFNTNATIFDPVTAPTGGIVAGSNQTRTEIRPTGNSQMLLTPRRWSFSSINPTGTLAFTHDFGRLKIEHAWRASLTKWDSNSGRNRTGGQLNLRTNAPIGFILDQSDINGRIFTQTSGPDVYDPNSYRAFVVTNVNTTTIPVAQTSTFLTKRSTITRTSEWSGFANASYSFETKIPFTLKAGFDTVNRTIRNRQVDPRRWYAQVGYVPSVGLAPITTFEENHGGRRLPVYDPYLINAELGDTTKWYEDVNFTATQRYTSNRFMQESVDAYYLQGQTKLFGKLNLLAGARIEDVELETATFFRARSTPIAVQPDHFLRAAMDFNLQKTRGGYDKLFPSIHAAYEFTPNLKARASWSTSYSRPDLLQLVPATSVNEVAQTVTIGNPDLKPQMAKNIDLKLEYYFKNNGLISLAVYQKRITDYLPSGITFGSTGDVVGQGPDNGFDGLYGGFQILEPRNIGRMTLNGIELDYKQRLTFLPGAWKGLGVRGNITVNEAEGELFFSAAQAATGVPSIRKTKELFGVLPVAGNFGLTYNRAKWGFSWDVNYTGEYADSAFGGVSFNVGTPQFQQLITYRKPLTTMNAGVTYRVLPNATAYLNVNNFTEQGPERYLQFEQRTRALTVAPMAIVIGIQGSF
jgi:TonB-dependent receptor